MQTNPDDDLRRAIHDVLALTQLSRSKRLNTATLDYILRTLNMALRYLEEWPQVREILFGLAEQMERHKRHTEWSHYLRQGIETSIFLNDKETEAKLHTQLGISYAAEGKNEDAIRVLQKSYEYFAKFSKPQEMAQVLNALARVARNQRKDQDAISYVHQALALLDDAPSSELAAGYRLLGSIAFYQREWVKALNFFQKELNICEQQQEARPIAIALVNVGSVLRVLGSLEEAVFSYEKSLSIFREEGDGVYIALTQLNLGNLYLQMERFEQALVEYVQAEWHLREANEEIRLAMVYNNIGMAYAGLQKWSLAEPYYLESIEQWYNLSNYDSLANTMDNLGELYLQCGRHERARAVLQKAMELAQITKNDYLVKMVGAHLSAAESPKRR